MDAFQGPDRATAATTATTPNLVRRQENGPSIAEQDTALPQWRWWTDPAERTHRHARRTNLSSATKPQKISPCSVVMAAGRLLSAKIGSGKARSRVLQSGLAPGDEQQQQQHRLFADSGDEDEEEEGGDEEAADDSDLDEEDEFSSDSLSEWEDDDVVDEEDDGVEEGDRQQHEEEERRVAHGPGGVIDRQRHHHRQQQQQHDNQLGRGWSHRFPNEPHCERSTPFPSDAQDSSEAMAEKRVPHLTYPTPGGGEISVRYVKSIPKPLEGQHFVLQCAL